MTNEEIFSHVDHTLLKATAGWKDIEKLCKEAEKTLMNIKAAIIDHEMASLSEREIFACSQEQKEDIVDIQHSTLQKF